MHALSRLLLALVKRSIPLERLAVTTSVNGSSGVLVVHILIYSLVPDMLIDQEHYHPLVTCQVQGRRHSLACK